MQRPGEVTGVAEISTLLHRYNKAEMAIKEGNKGVNCALST